jgi:hypothetical protein
VEVILELDIKRLIDKTREKRKINDSAATIQPARGEQPWPGLASGAPKKTSITTTCFYG